MREWDMSVSSIHTFFQKVTFHLPKIIDDNFSSLFSELYAHDHYAIVNIKLIAKGHLTSFISQEPSSTETVDLRQTKIKTKLYYPIDKMRFLISKQSDEAIKEFICQDIKDELSRHADHEDTTAIEYQLLNQLIHATGEESLEHSVGSILSFLQSKQGLPKYEDDESSFIDKMSDVFQVFLKTQFSNYPSLFINIVDLWEKDEGSLIFHDLISYLVKENFDEIKAYKNIKQSTFYIFLNQIGTIQKLFENAFQEKKTELLDKTLVHQQCLSSLKFVIEYDDGLRQIEQSVTLEPDL
jgi:hypothetical protein